MGFAYNAPFTVSHNHTLGMDRPAGRSSLASRNDDGTPVIHISATIPGGEDLIRRAGWQAREVESLDALVSNPQRSAPSCLVLHLTRSGLDYATLIGELLDLPPSIPVICLADDVDLAVVVGVMKVGALDVLRMPVSETSLLDAIRQALQRSEAVLKQEYEMRQLKERYEALSQRERQVMTLVASGLLNKQVGGTLGISEITVKAHRGRVMSKMQANSFASLIKMATTLAI